MKKTLLITCVICTFITKSYMQVQQTTLPDTCAMLLMSETTTKYDNGPKYFKKNSNKPFSGFLYARYDNGNLLSVQQFENGVGHGVWIDYDPEGNKVCQGTYFNNRVEGPVTFYYEDGSIKSTGQYKHWKRPVGTWIYYDRQGKIVGRIEMTP